MIQVDMALLAGVLVCGSSGGLLRYVSEVSRLQLAWLYFAAGFLKLTKVPPDRNHGVRPGDEAASSLAHDPR